MAVKNVINFSILRSANILVSCGAGQREFPIQYQDIFKNKPLKHIFVSGQTLSKNGLPLTNTNFYLVLVYNNTVVFDLPATMLVYGNDMLIELDLVNIDWNQSKIVFPANLGAATNVELIAFYGDNNPPMS